MGFCMGFCSVIVSIIVICALAIIGGCLMGFSVPPQFPAPMFSSGYAVVMIDVFVIIVCVTWGLSDGSFSVTAGVSAVSGLAIIGGSLMGLATPPHFPTPMFIGGFVVIMIDSIVILCLLIFLSFTYGSECF